jgi:hypothetical protein
MRLGIHNLSYNDTHLSLHAVYYNCVCMYMCECIAIMGLFLFATASRPTFGPTQSPIQCLPGALISGVKRLGRVADHSPPSNTRSKSAWSYTYSCYAIRLSKRYVPTVWFKVKHRDNFTLYTYMYYTLLCCTTLPTLNDKWS